MSRPKAAIIIALLSVTVVTTGQAQTLNDDPAFALYRQAVQAAEIKDYTRAAQLSKEAIAQYPDHLLAWYLLGQAATARAAWDEAADAFANVVKRYPASFAAQRDLALALEQLGRVNEARVAYEAALARQPDNQDVRLRLAFMLFERDRDAAVPQLEILARANTAAPEVWVMLARAQYERGDLPASEKAFTRAVALRDDGKTWFNLGVVRLRLNQPAQAQEAFMRASAHAEVREQALRELEKLREMGRLGTK
jgi:tetratricopeptide (TPR) repeat protein